MFGIFKVAGKTLTAPIWLPWIGYKGLWWAFDTSPKPVTKTRAPRPAPSPAPVPAQSSSFEVVDSSPAPRPLPIKSLRAGYAATYLLSAMSGGIVAGLASDGDLSPARAWAIWAWVTGLLAVGTLMVVRRAAHKEIAKLQLRQRILNAPKAAAQAAAAGVKACCSKAKAAATSDQARNAAKWFASSATQGATAARNAVPSKWKAKLAPYFSGRSAPSPAPAPTASA